MKQHHFKGKKIGIWGFGVVGKSVLNFLYLKDAFISVYDQRMLTEDEKKSIINKNADFVDQASLSHFLEINDIIIPSPGIDLRSFSQYRHKWLSELDLFAQYVTIPVIAVTGTLGKTTTIELLAHCLNQAGKKAIAIGNNGYPMLEALKQQNVSDYFILELSSFQLELSTQFVPEIAVITNLYNNHLDRHIDFKDYIRAKALIFKNQTKKDWACFSYEDLENLTSYITTQNVKLIKTDDYNNITFALSDFMHKNTVQIICTVFDILNISLNNITQQIRSFSQLEHRMEYVGTINEIAFYNDSKGTVPEATLQAINQLQKKSITLLLGGLSKGINRKPFINFLKNKVSFICCFGKEATQLATWCADEQIPHSDHETLESAFVKACEVTPANGVILLSPAGASYDLFTNYKERGTVFKKLVENYKIENEDKKIRNIW